jgi:hypothetical protein
MPIIQAYCTTFKKQLLEGVHDFRPAVEGGDVFKIALYDESANLNATTEAYTSSGEIVADGYTAGGYTLSQVAPTTYNLSGVMTFQNASWTAPVSARGALIYNTTPAHSYTNPACVVLDFGMVRTVSSGLFTVEFPQATDATAAIRIN